MLHQPSDLSRSVADPGTTHSDKHRATLLRISDQGLTQGNLEILDDTIAEDYVVHSPFGDLNRDAVKGFFRALRGAFANFKVIRAQILVEGEFAATRSVVTGNFEHEFTGPTGVIQPNRQPVTLAIVSIFRFREDGLIAEEWAQFDNLGFQSQLGAVPTATQ